MPTGSHSQPVSPPLPSPSLARRPLAPAGPGPGRALAGVSVVVYFKAVPGGSRPKEAEGGRLTQTHCTDAHARSHSILPISYIEGVVVTDSGGEAIAPSSLLSVLEAQ